MFWPVNIVYEAKKITVWSELTPRYEVQVVKNRKKVKVNTFYKLVKKNVRFERADIKKNIELKYRNSFICHKKQKTFL